MTWLIFTAQKQKRRYWTFHFKIIKIRKLETDLIDCHFLTVCCMNIYASFKVDGRNFNNHVVFHVLLLTLCCITTSDINSSRSHPSYDWHRIKTSPAI